VNLHDLPAIDPLRFEHEWEENLEVIDRLARGGDIPELPRSIDVSFRGSAESLARLSEAAETFGFRVQSLDEDEEGEPWLFLERSQPADQDSIRLLTRTYLQLETIFDVECDGWGCLEQTGSAE